MKKLVDSPPAPAAPPKRKRNAVATRDAILQSAQIAFSRSGYDGVGVREIAREAGVTAILVNRYFGSKEELFVEVVRTGFAKGASLDGGPVIDSRRIAEQLTAKIGRSRDDVDPLLMTLRSASNDKAVAIIREYIADYFEKPLAAVLGEPLGAERAALIMAVIGGFELVSNILANDALASANRERLAHLLAKLLDALITNDEATV